MVTVDVSLYILVLISDFEHTLYSDRLCRDIMLNMTSFTHNREYITLHCQMRAEPRLEATHAEHFLKFGHTVFEIRERIDIHAHSSQYFAALSGTKQ